MDLTKRNNTCVLRGIIRSVYEPVEVGEKKFRKQQIIFEKPPFTDDFGEVKGNPQFWELNILQDAIDRLKVTVATHEGKKATVGFYVDSQMVDSKDDPKKKLFIINATLAECQLLDK